MSNNNGDTKLTVIGISHKSSSIEEREIFQLNKKDISKSLTTIFEYDGVEGVIIVVSCNRVEFYLTLRQNTLPFPIIEKFYLEEKNVEAFEYKNLFYIYEVPNVSRHLFKVISGMDSLVLGEYQIQGQVKEAYSLACQAKTVDKILHKVMHAAFRAGKKVRSETALCDGKQSVSGVAADLIKSKLKINQKIAVIGVNENSKILVSELSAMGYHNYIFINRTLYKAQMMVEQWGGTAYGLDKLEKVLFGCDAVFTSTAAPGFIINSEMLKRLILQERCPHLIVDMAMPRDTDQSALSEDIEYFDVDMLRKFLDEQSAKRAESLPEALKIIEDEVSRYQAWSDTMNNEMLEPYAEKFEIIRQQLLDEYRKQFSEQAYEKAEKMSKSLVHRLQSTFMRILIKEK